MSPNSIVAVAMPCFNEADGLEVTLRELNLALVAAGIHCVYFLQDDASTDTSVQVAESVARGQNIKLEVESNLDNRGHGPTSLRAYARALQSGFDYVVFLDSDGQFAPSDVVRLLTICMASREIDACAGVRTSRVDGVVRKCVSTLLRTLILFRFGVRAQDPNSPVRVFRRSALLRVIDSVPNKSLVPNVWLTVLAIKQKLRVQYLGVEHRHRSGLTSTGSTWRHSRASQVRSYARLLKFCILACREISTE